VQPDLPLGRALRRGLRGVCPNCGRAPLFQGFLRVNVACGQCDAPLGRLRADDAPPYFVILLVGHIVIPSMLIVERFLRPPLWVHTAIWVPLTLILAIGLLRPVKGATVGLMLRLGMQKSDAET
jgi:uncharacterized protein (DUF983 family)